MKELIGFWVICLAITVFIVGISVDLDFKEKVKLGSLFMTFITLLIIGVALMMV